MAEVVIDKTKISTTLKQADELINNIGVNLVGLADGAAYMSSDCLVCTSAKAPTYLAMEHCYDSFKELAQNATSSLRNLHSGLWGIAVGLAEGMDDNSARYTCTIEDHRPAEEMVVGDGSVKWEYSRAANSLLNLTNKSSSVNGDVETLVKLYQTIYDCCGGNADFWSQLNDAQNACTAIALKVEEIIKTFKEELTAALDARITAGKGKVEEQKVLVDSLDQFAQSIDSTVTLTYQDGTGTWEGLDWAPRS